MPHPPQESTASPTMKGRSQVGQKRCSCVGTVPIRGAMSLTLRP